VTSLKAEGETRAWFNDQLKYQYVRQSRQPLAWPQVTPPPGGGKIHRLISLRVASLQFSVLARLLSPVDCTTLGSERPESPLSPGQR